MAWGMLVTQMNTVGTQSTADKTLANHVHPPTHVSIRVRAVQYR